MKIAYAVHHLPPSYTGGAEHRALRTARWFQTHGHSARLLCIESITQAKPAVIDSAADGLFVRRVSFDHRAFADERWRYDNPIIERRTAEFLAEQRPDVFHLFSGYLMTAGAIRAAHAMAVPIVVSLTDFWFLCPRITLLRSDGALCPRPPEDPLGCVRCLSEERRRFRWPARVTPWLANGLWKTLGSWLPPAQAHARLIDDRRQILNRALANSNVLICPSRFLHDRFRETGTLGDELVVMRQGLAAPPPTAHSRPSPHRLIIGYAGQIKPHKGVDLLVDAAKDLARQGYEFTLALYGDETTDPRYSEQLRRRARGATWLEWRGVYRADRTWDILAELDVVVVPSRWYENSPNIILEAQAAGVPVVATNLGGMAELVRHDVDGLLFRLNDARNLSEQLARFFKEPDLRGRLSANAPVVKTLEQEMDELHALYRRLVARPEAIAARTAAA